MLLHHFTEAWRNSWGLKDFGGREGKRIQSHFKIHSWGDWENSVDMNKHKFTLKQKDGANACIQGPVEEVYTTYRVVTTTEQNC